MGIASGPPGGAQEDVVWPCARPTDVGLGVAIYPNGSRGHWYKFRLEKSASMTGIMVPIGTAANNLKVGVYSSDKTTLTQLGLSAETAAAGSNVYQTIGFTAAVPGVPFQDYYAFIVCDNTTLTVYKAAAGQNTFLVGGRLAYFKDAVYTTPPATQAIAGMGGGSNMLIPIGVVLA